MCPNNSPRRFLFVIGFTCPFPGAAWWRIFYFMKYFRAKGHQCSVLSCFSPNKPRSLKVVRNPTVRIFNVLPYIVGLSSPFILFLNSALSSIALIPSFLLIRPNVVIVSVPPVDQIPPVFLLSRIIKSKILIDYRDEFEDNMITHTKKSGFFYRFLKIVLTCIYRNALVVTPVTPAVAESLRQRGLCNVKVIHDGVDTKIFRPTDKTQARSDFLVSQDSFVIAYLGNVYNPYRLDIVVKALKKLKQKDPKRKYLLLLVGGGNVPSVLRLASSLGISDSVRQFGLINNPAKIARILSSADCGIIPYDDDPLWQKTYSTKLFEYCAVGLPVVGTVHENSALATVIRVNKIGLIVPPINSDALASSLEKMSADKESRIKMSLSALQFAQTYDKDKLASDLLETIETLQESAT